jgi:hypothetical protein
MTNVEEQLLAIGFARPFRDLDCWRADRIDGATRVDQTGRDPACSPALLHWRDLLARAPMPEAYRISRIAG